MIGDIPKGAPLRCRLRMHTGQRDGGLLVFTCPRCTGSYWQTRTKYTTAMVAVRAAEARGDFGSAHRIYKSTMEKPWWK